MERKQYKFQQLKHKLNVYLLNVEDTEKKNAMKEMSGRNRESGREIAEEERWVAGVQVHDNHHYYEQW